MSYLRGPARSEVQLLPPCLDDYVAANSPVRFIDAYVEGLDFKTLGFTHAEVSHTGRPPYHPADLLKLYIYGYLHRLRSSRRLEGEAARNLELTWLLRGLRPDFKTIADFRKNNLQAFKALFKQFNLLCRNLDLFAAELVAIDGSKFKAVNNLHRHYTQEQLTELVQKVEARIDQYLADLQTRDAELEELPSNPQSKELQDKINLLKERKGRYEELLGQLRQGGKEEIALTDADARKLKGPQGYMVGYNVQLGVDSKHDLIVAQEVVQDKNDRGQLAAVAGAAKESLQVEQLQVVADAGYHESDQLEACEKAAVEAFVPAPATTSGTTGQGGTVFPKEQFRYEKQADVYHCPGGETLLRGTRNLNRGKERIGYSNRAACAKCQLRSQCTRRSFRIIYRLPNEEVVERARERARQRKDLVVRRKEIVEHVFGTLRNWGHDTFLLRGLEKARAEFSLSALIYNLRRVLNIVSWEKLMKAV